MTVQTTTNSVTLEGNGVTDEFDYEFLVLDESHLVVERRVRSTGVLDHIYTSGEYTVDGIGDNAGSVTLLDGPLAATYDLVITRVVPYTQELDIVNQGGFYPDTVEDQLDRMVMMIQQVANSFEETEAAEQAAEDASYAMERARAAGSAAVTAAAQATQALNAVRTIAASVANDQPASAFAESLGFTDEYVAWDATTSHADKVSRRDSVIGDTDTTANGFFGVMPTHDTTTWPVDTWDTGADALTFDATDFTFTRPLVFYQQFYRIVDVDNTSVYLSNAGNTQRLNVTTNGAGTAGAKLLASAATTGTNLDALAFGLEYEEGDGEVELLEVVFLYTATRMAACINGEEVINFNVEVQNTGSGNNISLFAPTVAHLAAGSRMFIAKGILAQVDADFGDTEMRRLCTQTSANIADIMTVCHYGENAADDSYMNRLPVIAALQQTPTSVRGAVSFFASSDNVGYGEDPAEIRYVRFHADKDSGTITRLDDDSVVLDQPTGWPVAGAALTAGPALCPSYGPNAGKIYQLYSFPDDSEIVYKRSDDGYSSFGAKVTAFSTPTGFTDCILPGNGRWVETARDGANPGLIHFIVHDNVALGFALVTFNTTTEAFTVSAKATGTPGTRIPSEAALCAKPNGDLTITARMHVNPGFANSPNELGVYEADEAGGTPAFVTLLDGADNYEGAAVGSSIYQIGDGGGLGTEGQVVHVRALDATAMSLARHGTRLGVYGANYEELFAQNIKSRFTMRGYHDIVALTEWGLGWYLIAYERTLESAGGNGNSSVYLDLIHIENMELVW